MLLIETCVSTRMPQCIVIASKGACAAKESHCLKEATPGGRKGGCTPRRLRSTQLGTQQVGSQGKKRDPGEQTDIVPQTLSYQHSVVVLTSAPIMPYFPTVGYLDFTSVTPAAVC